MEESIENKSLRELEGQEFSILVEACLKNRWLSRGIPCDEASCLASCCDRFHMLAAESFDQLREYFRESLYGIREGVVYQNLAFVQQVDMGDEWLVLRLCFDEETGENYWVPFESYTMKNAIESPARFECAITALQDDDRFDTAVLFGASSRQRQTRSDS